MNFREGMPRRISKDFRGYVRSVELARRTWFLSNSGRVGSQNTASMNANTSTRLEDTPLAPGQTPDVGHKRSINTMSLQEGSTRGQTHSGEKSLQRCTRKTRAEEIYGAVACTSCCGYQNIQTIRQSSRSAAARLEPAAWKETPAEQSEWIAMFEFLSE